MISHFNLSDALSWVGTLKGLFLLKQMPRMYYVIYNKTINLDIKMISLDCTSIVIVMPQINCIIRGSVGFTRDYFDEFFKLPLEVTCVPKKGACQN